MQLSLPTKVIYTPYLIVTFVLLLLSICISKGDDVLWINGHHMPLLDNFFEFVTSLGEAIPFSVVLIVTLFIRFQYAVTTAIAWIMHGLLCVFCKQVLFPGMPRPRNILDNDLLHFVPGVNVHGHNSFRRDILLQRSALRCLSR